MNLTDKVEDVLTKHVNVTQELLSDVVNLIEQEHQIKTQLLERAVRVGEEATRMAEQSKQMTEFTIQQNKELSELLEKALAVMSKIR